MDSVHFLGVQTVVDEPPEFIFECQLESGVDYDGKFDVGFGLAELSGEKCFVIFTDPNQNVIGAISEDESKEIISTLLSKKEYKICINYENVHIEEIGNREGYIKPIFGRDLGLSYDYVNSVSVSDSHLNKFEEMREILLMEGNHD